MTDTTRTPDAPAAKVIPASIPAGDEPADDTVDPGSADGQAEAESAPDDSEGSEPETPDEETDKEPPKPKPKARQSASGRIAELHAQKRQAEAGEQMARREAIRLAAELADLKRARANPELSYEQADDLRISEAVKAERLSQAEAEVQSRQRQTQAALVDTFYERVEAARERMPDFDAVVTDQTPISPVMGELIAASELGPELAYHLGKNPAEARRLYGLPAHLVGAEIARLETRLSVPSRKVTKAPSPPPRIAGGGKAPVDPNAMSMEQYEAWRKKSAKG